MAGLPRWNRVFCGKTKREALRLVARSGAPACLRLSVFQRGGPATPACRYRRYWVVRVSMAARTAGESSTKRSPAVSLRAHITSARSIVNASG